QRITESASQADYLSINVKIRVQPTVACCPLVTLYPIAEFDRMKPPPLTHPYTDRRL
ncbi:hypothetical protein ACLKA7_000090, partial [Drosophila subpalustris]